MEKENNMWIMIDKADSQEVQTPKLAGKPKSRKTEVVNLNNFAIGAPKQKFDVGAKMKDLELEEGEVFYVEDGSGNVRSDT